MTIDPSLFKQAENYVFSETQRNFLFDIQTIIRRLGTEDHINDYAFIVSPAAKAYEGFLKDFFLRLHIIDKATYQSDRFRVGKTLNPSLRYKRFSIFKKLAEMDETGEELAETLWDAWKHGRNEIFHFFPDYHQNLGQQEAQDRINLILKAIIRAGEFLQQMETP